MGFHSLNEPTSLKEMFQGLVPDNMGVIQGKVIAVSPLKIQVVNDDKLILSQNIICLPRHLSTYQTTIDIDLGKGTIHSTTRDGQGLHPHEENGKHSGHSTGEGTHSHPDTEGAHLHTIATFNIFGASMTVYNGLKLADIVYILSFNQGKKYYILDREA